MAKSTEFINHLTTVMFGFERLRLCQVFFLSFSGIHPTHRLAKLTRFHSLINFAYIYPDGAITGVF